MLTRILFALSLGLLIPVASAMSAAPEKSQAAGGAPSDNQVDQGTADVDGFFQKFDKNDDGTVSKEELDVDQQGGFGRIDRNGDGRLDRREVQTHTRRMRQGGRPVETAVIWVIEAERDAPSLTELQDAYDMLRKLDSDQNDKITKDEIASARENLVEQHCQSAIKHADSDKDGKVSKQEAKNTVLERRFGKLDSDGDGSLTQDELKSSISRDHATASAQSSDSTTSRK